MTICAVPECEKETRRRSPYCYAHYMKNWRYGTPTPVHAKFREDLTGLKTGKLTVVRHHSSGKWVCVCECGSEVVKATSDLNRSVKRNGAASCGSVLCRRAEIVGYSAAHTRVRVERGPAAAHACVDCGKPAQHWSYCHSDPNELISTEPGAFGLPYSCDSSYYAPRCVQCHKNFDLERLGGTYCREIYVGS